GTLANSNYAITFVPKDFSITAMPITVTADAGQTKVYGAVDPASYTYASLPTGLLSNGATVSFTGALDRAAGENVGDWAIGQGTLANSNYAITFVPKDFSITAMPITVTADAGQTKVYGAADPASYTYASLPTGLLSNGATVSFTGALDRAAGENVGDWAIGQGTLANSNYAITFVPKDFSITAMPITVTADAGQTKVYGAVDPASYTYASLPTGLLSNGATVSFTGALDRAAGENVGNWAIGQGTLANSNYAITFVPKDFSITAMPITVTADAGQTKVYGAADPASYTYASLPTGLLSNGATVSFTGALDRAAGENVGNWAIGQGTLANSNYAITFVPKDFSITARPITVTADPKHKFSGQVDPPLTYQISDVLASTLTASVSSYPFIGNLSRIAGESSGIYQINQGTVSLGTNYELTYVPSNLTINCVTIDASTSSKPVPVGSLAILSAAVSPVAPDITVVFTVDNGNGVLATYTAITNGSGLATAQATLPVEVYLITATAGTGCASSVAYLPVYDPNGGFVTGGGWIMSPAGAYVLNDYTKTLSGKANFGFVAKYKKGNNEVDGNTEFQFQTGNLNFKSSSHEAMSLVIAGAQATYKGKGTINGIPGYSFMVSAIDGDKKSTGVTDKFRIKIWNGSGVVYDNQKLSPDNAEASTALGGGSIVIHEVKKNATAKVVIVEKTPEIVPFTITAYPNPSTQYFIIDIKGGTNEKTEVIVYDILGRMVKHIENGDSQEIKFGEELPSGTYIAIINQGVKQKTVRLVKK
ncbi:MBG domain-containing protein, partial [Flavobacterium sp. ZB4P13]|uniref:MBG domain-containing protein n=1 Tax=Flavobacterium sp. ZB4P13 TaxID=3401728 RepID=UPI003AAB2B48